MKKLADHNPAAIFLFYLAVLLPVMFTVNPVLSGFAVFFAFFYLLMIDGRKAWKRLWVLGLPVLMGVLNPLFSHGGKTILFFMNDNPVTLEAILYGVTSGLVLAGVLLWLFSFSAIMTGDKLLYLFGAMSPKLALILSMTMRYIPLYRRQIRKTNQAQRALGLYVEDDAMSRIKGGLQVFSVMVTWALENGVTTADSMEARGYGVGRRSFFALYRFRKTDGILIAASVLFCAMVFTGMGLGALEFIWYPTASAAEPGAVGLAAYCAYGLLAAIPAALEVKEERKWKRLR